MVENEDSKLLMDAEIYKMIQAKKTTESQKTFIYQNSFLPQTRGIENNNVFHVAAECGNRDFIKLALEHENIDTHESYVDLLYEKNLKGEIPLHLAAQSGDKKTFEILLFDTNDDSSFGDHADKKERYLCMKDKKGDTPLHKALRYGHQDIAILLVQRHANLAYLDNEAGESPAHLAAINLCERFLYTILDAENKGQSSISFSAPFGMNVFHSARNLNDDIMLALIERRKELLKHQDNKGKSVLHYVVEDAIEPMVDVLLKEDSSLALLHDNDGMTPLHRASSMGSFSIVRTILELCPQSISMFCDKGERAGQTPLHVAKMDSCFLRACLRHTSMKKLINVVDNEGNAPLHLALKHKCSGQDCANALLEVSGVNYKLMNNDGYTPMDLCKPELSANLVVAKKSISDINREVVETISKSNNNIPSNLRRVVLEYWSIKTARNVQVLKEFTSYGGVEGESIMHLAVRDCKSRVLVLSGENSKAETPLHVAAAAGNLEVVEAILELSVSTDKFGNKKPGEEEEKVAVVIETSNADVINDDDNKIEDSNEEQFRNRENSEWKPWKTKSAKGDTPLHMALRNGHEKVALSLLKWDPSLINTSVNKMNESILYLASLTGCSNVVYFLLRESEDNEDYNLSTGGPDGQNPLHVAVRRPLETTTTNGLTNAPSFNFDRPNVSHRNQVPAMPAYDDARYFLMVFMGDLFNKADNNGKTPLHYAVELNNLEKLCCGLFSCAEDYISAALMYDNEGFNPLLRAAANGSFKCARIILAYCGASVVELRHADDGSTMLHLLKVGSAHDLEKWVRIMKKYPKIKILINEIDKDGNTPLHCAILKSDINKAHLLLSTKGVRLSIQNKWRQTPMDLCTQLLTKGDVRHLAIWIALEDFEAKEKKRRSQVALLLRINTHVMMSYSDQGMSRDEDLKKLLENVAVAAALLITLTFAATFTIPGGYDQNTGEALRMKEVSVKTFVASNVVAMLLGVGVLLTYTFGATKKVWLRGLSIPCVVMLQCALLATIVSFISGVYALVFQDARWIATLSIVIVGAVLLLFLMTPAGGGVVIQILKWLRKCLKWLLKGGTFLLLILIHMPYLLEFWQSLLA